MKVRALLFLCSLLQGTACDAGRDGPAKDGDASVEAEHAIPTRIDTQEALARSATTLPAVLMTDLVIGGQSSDLEQVVLPDITEIRGGLFVVWTDRLTSVVLPNLTHVGKLVITGNAVLQRVELPRLQELDQLQVQFNGLLGGLVLPNVTRVQAIEIDANPVLVRVELAQTAAGPLRDSPPTVIISRNARLEHIHLVALTAVRELRIESNYALQALELSALERLEGGPWTERETLIRDNDRLEALRLPALVQASGHVTIRGRALTTLELPALVRAERLAVSQTLVRSLVLPRLVSVVRLDVFDAERIEAPELVEIGYIHLPIELRHLWLPKLTGSCQAVTEVRSLPDCAVESVVPSCAPSELHVKLGCMCSPDHDLMAARCPGELVLQ